MGLGRTHLATKVSHIIDFLVMVRMDHQMYCKDVRVMKGANCWTDHQLLRVKLRLKFSHARAGSAQRRSFSVYKLALPINRDAYVKCLEDVLRVHPYRADLCNEDNWQALRHCIVQAAEESIGRGKSRQPE